MGVQWWGSKGRYVWEWQDPFTGATKHHLTHYRKRSKKAEQECEAEFYEYMRKLDRQKLGLEDRCLNKNGWTVEQACDWWLERVSHRHATNDRYYLNQHLKAAPFGSTLLEHVSLADVTSWLRDKRRRYSAQSVNHMRGYLKRLYADLRSEGLYQGPATVDQTKKLKVPRKSAAFLEASEAKPLLYQLDLLPRTGKQWAERAALALYAGARKNEAFHLDAKDIRNGGIVICSKTDIERWVPIHPELKEYLDRALVRCKGKGLLWPGRDGKPMNFGSHASKTIRKACEDAGVTVVTFHQLRHTWESQCEMSGVSPAAIDAMGWSGRTGNVRQDTYRHLTHAFLAHELAKLHYPTPGGAKVVPLKRRRA